MEDQNSSKFSRRHQFWLLLAIAILIRYLPLVSIPFQWLESYFHEISHGIAALVTGGTVLSIKLFPNGAGLCTTQGGSRFIISIMGYSGAVLWGAMIYLLAKSHQKVAQVQAGLVLLLLMLSIILWARDLLTLVILLLLTGLFIVTFKIKNNRYFQYVMQLFGLSILLNGLFSPSYLIDGRHLGDGATLSNITGIPELIWVFLWSGFAAVVLYLIARKKNKAIGT